MHIPKENSVSLNLLIFKKFLTNGQKETLLNRELEEKYAIKCAKNNLCFKDDDCRNICLALWTFMKKVANMNKPARSIFITMERENSPWTFASQIFQVVSSIT